MVEDLGVDDLKQLINFYKQRSSDLELQVLQLQLKMNKVIANQVEPMLATKTTKTK